MMGIQNVAAIFCITLIPFCWDTKYGSHILYPLKDQRRDTEYGRHTKYGVTPVSPLLTLDSTEQSTMKGLCKLVYKHETWHRCR